MKQVRSFDPTSRRKLVAVRLSSQLMEVVSATSYHHSPLLVDSDGDGGDVAHHCAVVLVASLYAIVATENTKLYAKSKFVCMNHKMTIC